MLTPRPNPTFAKTYLYTASVSLIRVLKRDSKLSNDLRSTAPAEDIGGDDIEDGSPRRCSHSTSCLLPFRILADAFTGGRTNVLFVPDDLGASCILPGQLLRTFLVDTFRETILDDLGEGHRAALKNIFLVVFMLLSTLDLGPVSARIC